MKLVHGTAAQIAASDFMTTLSRGLFRLLIIVGRSPTLSVRIHNAPSPVSPAIGADLLILVGTGGLASTGLGRRYQTPPQGHSLANSK